MVTVATLTVTGWRGDKVVRVAMKFSLVSDTLSSMIGTLTVVLVCPAEIVTLHSPES